jgi:hypothetical protein
MTTQENATADPALSTTPQVSFVVAGAQKAGTRALRNYLSQHPDIGLSRDTIPETHFFSRYAKEAEAGRYDIYHDNFDADALRKPAVGDVTPLYIFDPAILPRIRRYNPGMKIIVLLRDPVARAYSQWAMQHDLGLESRAFGAALLHELYWFCRYGQHIQFSYIQRGLYAGQITRLFAHFPPEQCLILRNEDLRDAHAETLARIHQFLGVCTQEAPTPKTVHSRSYPAISPPLRWVLRQVFRRDIRKLEQILGWDCRDWRAPLP